ncbi:MAG: DNA-binding response regulator, partial [Bacillota bacterium]|nr:DNA-binding response regulator [Bacillota bacterium]
MEKDVKILVVDDEERIRRLLKMYLEREEYSIDEA